MEHSNLNKLITAFLTLAIVVSASALLLSPGSQFNPSQPAVPEKAEEKKSPTVPANAFVESLPLANDKNNALSNVDSNLTDALAQGLAQKLLEANPAGPETINGELAAIAPTPDEVINTFLENPEIYPPLVLQEINIFAKRTDPKKVEVIEKPSQEDILEYLQGFNAVMEGELLRDSIQKVVQDDPSPQAISILETTFQSAIAKLDKLRVPRPLLGLHISARDNLISALGMLGANAQKTDDPLLSLLALQKESAAFQKSIDRLKEEAAKLPVNISSVPESQNLSWWQAVLIKRATAATATFVPTGDVLNTAQHTTTSIASWSQFVGFLKDWIEKYLLETIKTRLVQRLTQSAISWIRGNGQPKFVTNWRGFLDQTANAAIGDVISKLAPQMCSSFGQLVRLTLEPTLEPLVSPVACTLDQVIANVQNFYNDFNQGGWIAYTTALKPQNNFLGALMVTSDIAEIEAALKREAAQSEAVAGQGYIGDRICSKWEWQLVEATSTNPDGTKPLPSKQMRCVEYKNTTPGSTVGHTINETLLATVSRIVNAQTLTNLVNMLIDSALNKLLNPKKDRFGGESGILGVEQGTTTPTFQFCDGLSGRAYKQCVKQVKKSCEQLESELKESCTAGIVEPPPEGVGVCADPGNSISDYADDLQAAINEVLSDPEIANAPNTTENSFAFLNKVAEALQAKGFNATTNVKNGNDNPNTGDLIAIWKSEDPFVERYDAVEGAGGGDKPMSQAGKIVDFTGDIPLSCVAGGGGGGGETPPPVPPAP